ncbi:predicted protein [Naegleria gruberi]|uniref:Predicted protein n=1 Tax=Naegleria gruberi TaxID=5762 RepID=D2W194_NAEGR|nr:uncharacterized protein NAEGRDRAFT_75137 [Naegleria gruberi]EFC37144.1 predicted protein [Naegleria gruberi]|eukprot:XP_002669888.1 predicted protein [Naegleria gruberi strain NEG-M]
MLSSNHQQVLFLSNQSSSMEIDGVFEKCNLVSLHQLTNLEIKKICPSSRNSFIWTSEEDRIFKVGRSNVPIESEIQYWKNPLNCFEWKWKERVNRYLRMNKEMASIVDGRVLNLKNIYASWYAVFLELDDGVFFAVNDQDERMWKLEKEIKMFVTSPCSNHALVVLEDDELINIDSLFFQMPSSETDQIDGTIVKAATSAKSDIIFTDKNKMFCRGDNRFNVQNGTRSNGFYSYVRTPFENESLVQQVKCGLFHTAVMLENKSIYVCGQNKFNQCGVSSKEDQSFTKIQFSSDIIPESLYCGSDSTGFTTKFSTSLYVFGGMLKNLDLNAVEHVQQMQITQKKGNNQQQPTESVSFEQVSRFEPFELISGVKGIKLSLKSIPNADFNSVVFGDSYMLVFKRNELIGKTLNYIHLNMKRLGLQIDKHYSDLVFHTEC